MYDLSSELTRRRAQGLYRTRTLSSGGEFPEIDLAQGSVLDFSSNNYLGLAAHPDVVAAFHRGAARYGVGARAAHLVSGHCRAHQALEEDLAAFTGRSRALLFSTGYMANLGVVSALLGRNDQVFEDRLNHASLLDAGQLSRAALKRYRHVDMAALRTQLKTAKTGHRLIATDGVFSMDGDLAPLRVLAEEARAHDAWLMVDDAHGIGVLGDAGGGSLNHWHLDETQVPILMGTFGKALGTFGAFVAGSDDLIETLIQQARSYIYTTATPPALAEATQAALRIVRREAWRRERLRSLIGRFRSAAGELGLPLMDSHTPIQPLLAGTADRALAWGDTLRRQGILVTPIRPPTVPEGSARLRVTLSVAHTDAHLEQLLEALSLLPLEPWA